MVFKSASWVACGRFRARTHKRTQRGPSDAESPWKNRHGVFPSVRACDGHRKTVQKHWEHALAAEAADARTQGLPALPANLVLYCSRHTFATNLLDETGNIALVGKVLGHEDLRTTQKYLHPETTGVAEIVNQRNKRNGMRLVANAV